MSNQMKQLIRRQLDNAAQQALDEIFVEMIARLTDLSATADTVIAYVPESHSWKAGI
jgi:hypothetical protein